MKTQDNLPAKDNIKKTTKETIHDNCKIINVFKNDSEEARKKAFQEGIANLICRMESNDEIKYTRVK